MLKPLPFAATACALLWIFGKPFYGLGVFVVAYDGMTVSHIQDKKTPELLVLLPRSASCPPASHSARSVAASQFSPGHIISTTHGVGHGG